jgi:hypothetical protein
MKRAHRYIQETLQTESGGDGTNKAGATTGDVMMGVGMEWAHLNSTGG